MNKPYLTICIPTYNRAHLLNKFYTELFGVLYGFEKEIDILVSNNGSLDDTNEIATTWKSKYEAAGFTFTYYVQTENIGLSKNLTFLIKNANGKFLTILGDDDRICHGVLSDIIAKICTVDKLTAIIQGFRSGNMVAKNYNFQYVRNVTDLFYEYGNTTSGIINTALARQALGRMDTVDTIVWPHTAVGFVAMESQPDGLVFVTNYKVGEPIVQSQNITNKKYWIESLYGLLKAASMVDKEYAINHYRRSFISITNYGFISHLRAIVKFNIIENNIASGKVCELLSFDYGLKGKIWAKFIYIIEYVPYISWIISLLFLMIERRISFKSAKMVIDDQKAAYFHSISLAKANKKRSGDWF